MLEFLQFVFDVSWHEQLDGALIAVPFEGHSTTESEFPIGCEFVQCSNCLEQVVSVALVGAFDSKTIGHKCEGNVLASASLQAGGSFAGEASAC